MLELIEQNELYAKENALLKATMAKKDEMRSAEHEKYSTLVDKMSSEREELTGHLKTSLDMNKDWQGKYISLQEAMTQSSTYISQLKSVNDKYIQTNKQLSKKNDELLRKAKSYQH